MSREADDGFNLDGDLDEAVIARIQEAANVILDEDEWVVIDGALW